jgi:DNA-binding CsgD family transcriptional regulator/GAF domain-containing protein
MSTVAQDKAVRRIEALAREGLDLVTFWRRASRTVQPLVPHYMDPCWFTLDPATLLLTSHHSESMPQLPHEALMLEYYEDDVHSIASVAASAAGVSTLHDAAGGDPRSSPRWKANMELGADQELIVGLRTSDGQPWGALSLYREPGERAFSSDEIGFLRRIAPTLAAGARRALLLAEAREPSGEVTPGLLVLDASWEIESATPGVERWLADLPGGGSPSGPLPAAVQSVAGRAMRSADGRGDPGEVAMARVLSRSGTWVVLHGATLDIGGARRVAVIVEPAHPARIAPLLMSAYMLTAREQEVTRLVLHGESTQAIARRLIVSAHTVQQHLKSIFEKTGVRSRRDLVGKVFFSCYEPRLRDNETRAAEGRPLRGGPMGASNRPHDDAVPLPPAPSSSPSP